MKSHPYADLFPMMTDAELDLMAADIKGGQRSPVILDQHGLVVDGRNRLAACERAGLEPVTEVRTFPDDRAVLAFIVSANLHRRHLSETQRAMIAARIATMKSGARTDLGPIGPRS
jgi:ParB-like chromosome segregation protein Spo0J